MRTRESLVIVASLFLLQTGWAGSYPSTHPKFYNPKGNTKIGFTGNKPFPGGMPGANGMKKGSQYFKNNNFKQALKKGAPKLDRFQLSVVGLATESGFIGKDKTITEDMVTRDGQGKITGIEIKDPKSKTGDVAIRITFSGDNFKMTYRGAGKDGPGRKFKVWTRLGPAGGPNKRPIAAVYIRQGGEIVFTGSKDSIGKTGRGAANGMRFDSATASRNRDAIAVLSPGSTKEDTLQRLDHSLGVAKANGSGMISIGIGGPDAGLSGPRLAFNAGPAVAEPLAAAEVANKPGAALISANGIMLPAAVGQAIVNLGMNPSEIHVVKKGGNYSINTPKNNQTLKLRNKSSGRVYKADNVKNITISAKGQFVQAIWKFSPNRPTTTLDAKMYEFPNNQNEVAAVNPNNTVPVASIEPEFKPQLPGTDNNVVASAVFKGQVRMAPGQQRKGTGEIQFTLNVKKNPETGKQTLVISPPKDLSVDSLPSLLIVSVKLAGKNGAPDSEKTFSYEKVLRLAPNIEVDLPSTGSFDLNRVQQLSMYDRNPLTQSKGSELLRLNQPNYQ